MASSHCGSLTESFPTTENPEGLAHFPDSELYQNKGLFGLQHGKLTMKSFWYY